MVDFYSYKMKAFVVGCVFVAYFLHSLVAKQKGCSFSAHGDGEKYTPVLLQNNTSLYVPRNGNVSLSARETITMVCPDPKNYITKTHSNITQAQCIQGRVLRVANHDYNFEDLHCEKLVRGTVSETGKKCGDDQGRIYKIGYPLNTRAFIKLIEVCYDSNVGTALYSEHLVHGQDIKYASKSNYRPPFSTDAVAVSASVAYKQAFQKSTFNRLLKSANLAKEYIREGSFLARGHLSPDADFLYAATQYTTYYYINTCPQWQAINAGNWRKVESMVRKVAESLRETLTVITGTHGVLTLPDYGGQETEIYLVSGNKLPVPKFIWKIIYSKKSKRAVVLVNLNNPFVKEGDGGDIFCENVCRKVNWDSSTWDNYGRGYVYCCDYGEFSAVVKTAPKLQVAGLLQRPK